MNVPFTIYTIGNLNTLTDVYKYLVMLVGENVITTTAKIAVIWGLLFAILASVFKGRFHIWIYHFLVSYFIYWIFFMPVATVSIYDTITGQSTTVRNVPFGVAFMASMASTFSYEITYAIDNVFQLNDGSSNVIVGWTPETGGYIAYNGPGFLQTGYGGLFDYLKMGLEIDPKFAVSDFGVVSEMDNYLQQCFFPYLASLSPSQVNSIITSTNLLSAIAVKSSLFMTYNGQTYTCDDFYKNVLTTDWKNFVNNVSQNPEMLGIEQDMITNIVSSMNALTGADLKFNQIITQAGIINMMKEDYFASGLTSNMNDRLLASYVVGRSEAQAKLYGEALFLWASKAVPTLQNFLEDFFVILFPFLVILIFLPLVSFGGVHAAIGYLKVVAWAYLITPVLAIINDIITVQAINQTTDWLQSIGLVKQNAGLALANYGYLLSQGDLFPAIAGAAAMSAPLWAWMLLQGFETGVMGMAELVGTVGAQFIGQEASAPVLTSNIARDQREILAGIMSGQTALESLSNAGTWMFEQNANLPEMYNAVGGYRAYTTMEHDIGIDGVIQGATAATWFDTSLRYGKGLAAWNGTGANTREAENTGAMKQETTILSRNYGRLGFIRDANGRIVGVEAKGFFNSDMVKMSISKNISQAISFAKEQAVNLIFGNKKAYQEAHQAMNSVTNQYLQMYEKGEGRKVTAAITQNDQVKQSLSDIDNLAHALSNALDISKDKAFQMVMELGTAGGGGGNLKSLLLRIISNATPNAEAKGSEIFDNKQLTQALDRFEKDKAYQHVQEAVVSYAKKDEAFYDYVKKEAGSQLQSVSYQQFKQMAESWEKMQSFSSAVSDGISQNFADSGSITVDTMPSFFNYITGGDIKKEIELFDAMHEAAVNNNPEFWKDFRQAYLAYAMHMSGMDKDMSSKAYQYIETAKKNLMEAVNAEVGNGLKNVLESYGNWYKNNIKTEISNGVNPFSTVPISGIFDKVDAERKTILGNIIHGKAEVDKPPSLPPYTTEVINLTKHSPAGARQFGKDLWYVKNKNPGWSADLVGKKVLNLWPPGDDGGNKGKGDGGEGGGEGGGGEGGRPFPSEGGPSAPEGGSPIGGGASEYEKIGEDFGEQLLNDGEQGLEDVGNFLEDLGPIIGPEL